MEYVTKLLVTQVAKALEMHLFMGGDFVIRKDITLNRAMYIVDSGKVMLLGSDVLKPVCPSRRRASASAIRDDRRRARVEINQASMATQVIYVLLARGRRFEQTRRRRQHRVDGVESPRHRRSSYGHSVAGVGRRRNLISTQALALLVQRARDADLTITRIGRRATRRDHHGARLRAVPQIHSSVWRLGVVQGRVRARHARGRHRAHRGRVARARAGGGRCFKRGGAPRPAPRRAGSEARRAPRADLVWLILVFS